MQQQIRVFCGYHFFLLFFWYLIFFANLVSDAVTISETERMISFEFTQYKTSFLNTKAVCTDPVKSNGVDLFFRR